MSAPESRSRPHPRPWRLLAVVLALAAHPTAALGEALVHYEGIAREPSGTRVAYLEEHYVRRKDDRVTDRLVVYTCADGRPFARKQLNYERSPLVPELKMNDARAGMNIVLSGASGRRELTVSTRDDPEPRHHTVPGDPDVVADAGFNELLLQRWDPLIRGEDVSFRIVLLGSGAVHRLKAEHVEHVTVGGEERDHFRVALGGLLGLIAPSIDVWYSTRGHVLRRYEGISNLRDERGHQLRVVIDFPVAPPAAATEADWQHAMERPLDTSCGS